MARAPRKQERSAEEERAALRDKLVDRLRRMIVDGGPISVAQYMAWSNGLYYGTRDPLGSAGDFTTAPEISQMFGELVGLWLADIWHRAGAPRDAAYVELGPGRGTLAVDALRAMRSAGLVPASIELVEASRVLRRRQQEVLPAARFHEDLASLPEDRPLLIVANEFLDALPIRQLVKTREGWREVMVGLEGEALALQAGTVPMDAAVPPERRVALEGTVLESSPAAAAVIGEVAERLARQGGAALFIDYGFSDLRAGSTLQAVHAHGREDPLAMPGGADLSAHVDFVTAAQVAEARGSRWLGTATQGDWLRALGIDQRAAMLARTAPARAGDVALAHERLCSPDAMGTLFKVMGLSAPHWPDGAGF